MSTNHLLVRIAHYLRVCPPTCLQPPTPQQLGAVSSAIVRRCRISSINSIFSTGVYMFYMFYMFLQQPTNNNNQQQQPRRQQQTTSNKQQTTNNKQQTTTNNKQQTTNKQTNNNDNKKQQMDFRSIFEDKPPKRTKIRGGNVERNKNQGSKATNYGQECNVFYKQLFKNVWSPQVERSGCQDRGSDATESKVCCLFVNATCNVIQATKFICC